MAIVAGDTKVVEGNGGIYINTTGVGFIPEGVDIKAVNSKPGDVIIVSGNLGEHHATILSSRMGITNSMESDNAPLLDMVTKLREAGIAVHVLRDITRGGLATVLKELAVSSGLKFEIEETALPVSAQVKDFCGLLGLDPLYMGNEGKLAAVVAPEDGERALAIMKSANYGSEATIVGHVTEPENEAEQGRLVLKTRIGGRRILDVLQGEGFRVSADLNSILAKNSRKECLPYEHNKF